MLQPSRPPARTSGAIRYGTSSSGYKHYDGELRTTTGRIGRLGGRCLEPFCEHYGLLSLAMPFPEKERAE